MQLLFARIYAMMAGNGGVCVKKIAMLLAAALLLCAMAAAETVEMSDAFLTLPEGFVPVSQADMEGYREAAARDAGGRDAGEALLARREGASISVLSAQTDCAEVDEAAPALIAEYAGYVEGFESVEPQYLAVGGRKFACIQVSVDGEVASQYLLVEGGKLYVVTFMGVREEEMLATLESFAPRGVQTPAPSAAAAPEASPLPAPVG